MRQELTFGPPGPPSLGQMPCFVCSHGQAVPAASQRRLDHLHDTFPCPYHRDQHRRAVRSPAGSTRLKPLTPQNLATSAKVPPGHPVPNRTITPFPRLLSHGPGPYMTPRQPLGLQPHPAREQRPPKRLFPHLKKKSKKTKGKKISKRPRGSGRPGGQSTPSRPPSRHFLVSISPRPIV